GRVARREPGATVDEDRLDLRTQEPCLDLLADALRLVRKDRVLDDAVPELDQEVTRQGAARIGLRRPRVAHGQDGARDGPLAVRAMLADAHGRKVPRASSPNNAAGLCGGHGSRYMVGMRVLVHLGDSFAEQIAAACPGVEAIVIPTADPIDPALRADALLTLPWGTPNLAALLASTGVRWVHTVGTGVDRFPLDAIGDRLLTCSRGARAIPIAEWVLAQMLAFEKDLPDVWLTARPTSWNFHPTMGGLHGKTLGLVGIGGIGRAVAERALPFGMRVRAFRRTAASSPLPAVEIAESLGDLMASADHLVLVAPATPETRGMI